MKTMIVVHQDITTTRQLAQPVAIPISRIARVERPAGIFATGRNAATLSLVRPTETLTVIERPEDIADLANGDLDPSDVKWRRDEERAERKAGEPVTFGGVTFGEAFPGALDASK